jgi:NTP pyrophosphatase (non-canonical NTP hydrolase)
MDYFELECAVEQWAKEKGILEKATPNAQALKTLEECTELLVALEKKSESGTMDAIGDIVVTLIIQCKMHGWTLEECLKGAWNEIKDRKGKMIDGQFVKETPGA